MPDAYWTGVAAGIAPRKPRPFDIALDRLGRRLAEGSSRRYAARIRNDGKVLCLRCRKHLSPRSFWVSGQGTFLNRCKKCGKRKSGPSGRIHHGTGG